MKFQGLLTIGLVLTGICADLEGQQQSIAIQGDTIHTMARNADGQWMEPIKNGVVLVIDGKVAAAEGVLALAGSTGRWLWAVWSCRRVDRSQHGWTSRTR